MATEQEHTCVRTTAGPVSSGSPYREQELRASSVGKINPEITGKPEVALVPSRETGGKGATKTTLCAHTGLPCLPARVLFDRLMEVAELGAHGTRGGEGDQGAALCGSSLVVCPFLRKGEGKTCVLGYRVSSSEITIFGDVPLRGDSAELMQLADRVFAATNSAQRPGPGDALLWQVVDACKGKSSVAGTRPNVEAGLNVDALRSGAVANVKQGEAPARGFRPVRVPAAFLRRSF